jgi:potassium/hydrogen antiporter
MIRAFAMSVSSVILAISLFLLIGIFSSKFSARLGMPVLVLFIGVGMLAGSEGVGGIHFENYEIANSLGSLALALILFDGGLRTSLEPVRWAWKPALLLSTVGVVLTSFLTGLAAAYVLNIPVLYGMLLGSIIGSTDAAAVFSIPV